MASFDLSDLGFSRSCGIIPGNNNRLALTFKIEIYDIKVLLSLTAHKHLMMIRHLFYNIFYNQSIPTGVEANYFR